MFFKNLLLMFEGVETPIYNNDSWHWEFPSD